MYRCVYKKYMKFKNIDIDVGKWVLWDTMMIWYGSTSKAYSRSNTCLGATNVVVTLANSTS